MSNQSHLGTFRQYLGIISTLRLQTYFEERSAGPEVAVENSGSKKNDRLGGATSRRSRERRKRVEESRRQGAHFIAALPSLLVYMISSKFLATSTY